jgi:NDP-sugar pyrophosphorylase family protein
LGKRLRPLTDDLPKPLIPIFQKPLITFVLDHLIQAGIESFVINTHHLPAAFEHVFGRDAALRRPEAGNLRAPGGRPSGPSLPVRGFYRDREITFVHEPEILGTGGGIKNVERLLKPEPFISYSGDLLTDIDVTALIREHFRAGNDVTLALRETKHSTDVALEGNRVVDLANRYGREGRCDFAGVAVWGPAIFERIPPGRHVSYISVLADWIGQGGQIGGVVLGDGKWFNIGSRGEYLEVHHMIKEERWRPAYLTAAEWPVEVAADALIDPSARLSGFCSVGAGCRVGADAILENTILWPGAQIASRSHLRNCIVRSHRKAEGEQSDIDI